MWKCSVFNLHPTPSKYLPSVSSPQPHFTRVCSSDRTAQQRNGLEGVAELNVCIVQTRRTMQRIKEAWPVRISLISLVLCCSYCEWGALWIIGISCKQEWLCGWCLSPPSLCFYSTLEISGTSRAVSITLYVLRTKLKSSVHLFIHLFSSAYLASAETGASLPPQKITSL